jgi:dihydropteroate synthase type 2
MPVHPGRPLPRPRIVGVVNITTDSFSDGGRYLATRDAIAHALRLWADGADLVELGAAASHPDAVRVPAELERRRLAPVLAALRTEGVAIGVDSYQPEVQRFAIDQGVHLLNDIRGFPDSSRYDMLAASNCRLLVMHSVQRGPATRVSTDAAEVWAGTCRFLTDRLDRLVAAGVARDRLIADPGLGYFLGDTPEPSLTVLARIGQLRARLAAPVLVCPSRKSFLRAVTGREVEATGPASLAAELHAAAAGVDYIRTHDVAALHDALAVRGALIEHAGRTAVTTPR